MAGKRNCSLFCAPQPIARLIQVFPKLALVFFVIHFTVMIYSFFSPSPHTAKSKEVPPGVVDPKLMPVNIEYAHRIHRDFENKTNFHKKNDTASSRVKSKSLILQGLRQEIRHNSSRRQEDNKRLSILKKRPGR